MAVTPWRARDKLRRRVVAKVGNRRTDWPVYKAILFNLNDKKVKFPSGRSRSVEKPPDSQRSGHLLGSSIRISGSSSGSVGGAKVGRDENGSSGSSRKWKYAAFNLDVCEYGLVLKRGKQGKSSHVDKVNKLLDKLISNFEARFCGPSCDKSTVKKFEGSQRDFGPLNESLQSQQAPGEKGGQQKGSLETESQLEQNCWEQVVKDKARMIEMHAF